MQEVFRETAQHMKKAVDHLHDDLKTLRTGRANTSILDGVKVDYYGTPTPLRQAANLAVSDATLITAQPYDPGQIGAIEKAIQQADLGLNPSNDGRLIRIPIPPLNEERRKEMVRRAHDMAESARTSVRQARRDANEALKKLEKEKEISQDEEHRGHEKVQELHDKYIGEISESLSHKEKDIMEV